MSVRDAADHSPNNQVAFMIAELPIGVADPVERLAATSEHLAALKASHQRDGAQALTALAAVTPPMLYALGLRTASAAMRLAPQRGIQTVTTNVPGPQIPLYALGRELLEYLPYVPLSQGAQIGRASRGRASGR